MAGFRYTEVCLDAIKSWSGILSAPSKENRQRLEGIPVFENHLIEHYFASAHPILPGLWAIPVALWGVWASWSAGGQLLPMLGLFLAGMLIWSFKEYMLHRFAFHMKVNPDSWDSKFSAFMMHGYHHEFPSDKRRLVAPPIMAWPIGAIMGVIYYFSLGAPYWTVIFAGNIVGYLAYDWIHYYTHHFRPKTRVGKFLRRYHMEHHFKDQDTHFGISSPLWDLALGTYTRPTAATQIEIDLIGDDGAGPDEAAAPTEEKPTPSRA